MLEFAEGIALAEFTRGCVRARQPWRSLPQALRSSVRAAVAGRVRHTPRVVGGDCPLLVGLIALADRPLLPELRWVILLGAASYAMYLLHSLPTASWCRSSAAWIDASGLRVLSGMAIALAGTIVASMTSTLGLNGR